MDWIQTFDAVFFISLGTLVVGAFGASLKYCLKSKCEKFNCCFGLFVVERRVDLEVQEELRELELNEQKENHHDEENIA